MVHVPKEIVLAVKVNVEVEDERTDEEILESISRTGRLISTLTSVQGRLMNEARARGISNETVLNAARVSKTITPAEREKNRKR